MKEGSVTYGDLPRLAGDETDADMPEWLDEGGFEVTPNGDTFALTEGKAKDDPGWAAVFAYAQWNAARSCTSRMDGTPR